MTEIHFLITEQSVNSMTWEEYEAFERAQEGNVKMYQIRPILARFMVNGDGVSPIPLKQAMKILGELPMPKIQETITIFGNALRDGTIPNGNGGPSKLPLEAASEVSPSQAG